MQVVDSSQAGHVGVEGGEEREGPEREKVLYRWL